jgi:hypothetical protein
MEDENQMPKRKPNMSKALILEFKKKVLYKKHEQLLYLGDFKWVDSPAYMPMPPVKKNKLKTDLYTSVEKDPHNSADPDALDTKKKPCKTCAELMPSMQRKWIVFITK